MASRTNPPLGPALLVLLSPGCASSATWDNADALAARSVEVSIDGGGRPLVVEYFIGPETVPTAIYDAMNALYKGGQTVAAQKEQVGDGMRWVLIKRLDGLEVEASFTPEGELKGERVEVFSVNVPEAAKKTARIQFGGEITKWQEVRDGRRDLVEYHAHVTSRGMDYKIRVSAAGRLLGIARKVPAQIEIPTE